MKRVWWWVMANIIFIVHCAVLFVAVFGWLFPSIWYGYMALLVVILALDWLLGYCILSKWEFMIRKKLKPHLNYDYSFSSYYTYRLTQKRLSEHFVSQVGSVFLIISIVANILVRFVV
jgi:hypothetical protein